MAATPKRSFPNGTDERGAALVGVLLLLMMMTALAAALSVSGRTETLVASNHRSATQARLAAEAGLNHAVEVVSTYIFEWNTHGYADADAAVDGLLAGVAADPDFLMGEGLRLSPTPYTVAGVLNTTYEAFVFDEDDADAPPNGRGTDATDLTGDADLNNNEDNVATTDNNRTLVVKATGYAPDNTRVTLEAVISPPELGAIVTNGDLTINGNLTVEGAEGSVHSNGDLTTNGAGNSSTFTGDVTTSGTYTGTLGSVSSGEQPVPIPTIRAADYRHYADYLLTSAGAFQCDNSAGCTWGMTAYPYAAVIRDCTTPPSNYCSTNYGIDYSTTGGTTKWSFVNDLVNGTYYAETDATVSGPGTPTGGTPTPVNLTVIAEGSITVSGNTFTTPHTTELLFVTDVDLVIAGGATTGETSGQGQVLVHEQVSTSGSPVLVGQLIIEDATDTPGSPVSSNTIGGNVHITYDGGLGSGTYSVVGWREVR